MRLNEQGKCPVCLIKPLVYKRDGHYYCHRCSRAFSLATKELVENFAWWADGVSKKIVSGDEVTYTYYHHTNRKSKVLMQLRGRFCHTVKRKMKSKYPFTKAHVIWENGKSGYPYLKDLSKVHNG